MIAATLPEQRRIADAADPLPLAAGGALAPVDLEYMTWGRPDAGRGNAILVCHSFSADAHAAGEDATASAHWRPWRAGRRGWWDALIGEGRAIDTRRWWVICVSALGGSGGSSGPAHADPATGRPWGGRFPAVAIADLVAAQRRLMDQLDIPRWRLVAGGSMGGLQALTWGLAGGERVEQVLAIAAADRLGPAGRQHFRRGAALVEADLAAGGDGLAGLHRAIGSSLLFSGGPATSRRDDGWLDREWPLARLHPHAYLGLSRALLAFDIAQDWGGGDLGAAVRRIRARTTLVGYPGDRVFTPTAQARLAAAIRRQGGSCRQHVLAGGHGHDSFLVEAERLAPIIGGLLAQPARQALPVC